MSAPNLPFGTLIITMTRDSSPTFTDRELSAFVSDATRRPIRMTDNERKLLQQRSLLPGCTPT
jgi:hypothetical protein